MFNGTLERSILETLAYSDIFDSPLRLDELHRYLSVRAEVGQLTQALNPLNGLVGRKDGFHFLAGREGIVEIRRQREARSRKLIPLALKYGRLLGSLPFVRMVALTGSLAVMNISGDADFDYMLVAAQGRVWTARAFALLLNRLARLFGHTLCPNLIVAESALAWSVHDLYSARELCQMIPITGFDTYQRLMQANEWVKDFLPNATPALRGATSGSDEAISNSVTGIASSDFDSAPLRSVFLAMAEGLLHGKLGDRIEQWEMNRKIARFSRQPGFGEETVFNAGVCQGNFDHHRKWTRDVFEEKLRVIASGAKRNEAIPSRMSEIMSPRRHGDTLSPVDSSQ